VAGEDGIDDAGFSIQRILRPKGIFLEALATVRGDAGDLFSRRSAAT